MYQLALLFFPHLILLLSKIRCIIDIKEGFDPLEKA